jgi:hypothetical protein
VHGDSADDGLIFGGILADVDLLALLGRTTSIHEESLAAIQSPPSKCSYPGSVSASLTAWAECSNLSGGFSRNGEITHGLRLNAEREAASGIFDSRSGWPDRIKSYVAESRASRAGTGNHWGGSRRSGAQSATADQGIQALARQLTS